MTFLDQYQAILDQRREIKSKQRLAELRLSIATRFDRCCHGGRDSAYLLRRKVMLMRMWQNHAKMAVNSHYGALAGPVVLCDTDLLTSGFVPTSSPAVYLQQMGRARRPEQ